ncbi:TIGR04282 family arsenosugar biosynthesis glycosyltransferase [[Actinomadura] parvosata]|uniref:TIGR04282 family arsenosugar biosynthesis glycosyltransferase n=1 Tax=[Actinomadura] parvosata TaxID=1955412 RepID=UPI00406C96D6
MPQIVIIAKEPLPGRVKTRLTPPYSPEEAAALAEAALVDSVRAVAATPAAQRVLALDGLPGRWLPPGFAVVPQRGGGLDERLAAAFTDAHRLLPGPVVLIGMDTPQVTPALLSEAGQALERHDAVIGPAGDGGFWLLGLRRPDPALLLGVPMSHPETGKHQLDRLERAGLAVHHLPELTDVDTAADAAAVAAAAPASRFATTLRELDRRSSTGPTIRRRSDEREPDRRSQAGPMNENQTDDPEPRPMSDKRTDQRKLSR